MPRQTRSKRNWNAEVARVLAGVFEDHPHEELTLGDVTSLALKSNRIPKEYIEGIHEKALMQAFGRILRSSTLTTDDGRSVRMFQSYVRLVEDDSGKKVQRHFWKDIREMQRHEMLVSVDERSKHIKDSVESLKADVDFWNDKVRQRGERKIQLKWDFSQN